MVEANHHPESDALVHARRQLEAESGDSLKLLHNLRDNPICSVSLDKSVPCVVVTWRQYATSLQFRFVQENILHLLTEQRIRKVLGDDTALPTIHADDQHWIIENWMPRARTAGLKAIASINPRGYFGQLSVATIRASAPSDILFRTFDDMEEARRWLKDVVA